jgi:hypothetical protein
LYSSNPLLARRFVFVGSATSRKSKSGVARINTHRKDIETQRKDKEYIIRVIKIFMSKSIKSVRMKLEQLIVKNKTLFVYYKHEE